MAALTCNFSVNPATIGSSVKITVDHQYDYENSNWHLAARYGANELWITPYPAGITTKGGLTYTWSIPTSVASWNTTAAQFNITIEVYGYLYTTSASGITTSKDVSLTTTLGVKVPDSANPTISVLSCTDTKGYLATYGGYIQGKSQLKVSATASSVYSATISSYASTFDGVTKANNNATFSTGTAGTRTVSVTVTDSRKRVATKTQNITVLAYSAPVHSNVSVDRCNEQGVADDNGAYIKASFSSSISSLGGKNSKTDRIRYKTSTSSTWGAWQTGASLIFAANVDYGYDVQIQTTDNFTSTTLLRQVPATFVLMDFGGMSGVDGTGIAFGTAATISNTFVCDLSTRFQKNVDVYGDSPYLRFGTANYKGAIIRAYDNNTTYGHNMLVQSGALLIMGGGEYPANRYALSDLNGQDIEATYLGSDNQVYIETNGNTIANRKTFAFGNNGDLWMPPDGRVYVDSSTIDIDATSQASRVTTSGLVIRDTNDNVIGNVYAEQLANGATGFLLSARRGSTYNAVSLRVTNNGAREVYVDAPAEWRKALGLSYAAGDSYTVPSNTGQISCAGMLTSGTTAVYFFIPLSKPIDATSVTISGNVAVRSPQGYIYPTTSATSSYNFPVNTSGITQSVRIAPNGIWVTLTTSGWVTNSSGTAAQANRNVTVALMSGFTVTFA